MNIVFAVITVTVAELIDLARSILDGLRRPFDPGPAPVELSGSFGPQAFASQGPILMASLDHTVTVGDGPFTLKISATRHAHADAFGTAPVIVFADSSVFSATVSPGPTPDVYLIQFADPAAPGSTSFTVSTADGKASLTGTLTAVAAEPDALTGEFGDQTTTDTPAPDPNAPAEPNAPVTDDTGAFPVSTP